jgi:hypothetical protein
MAARLAGSALKAGTFTLIAGFVAFLAIGGPKSSYAGVTLASTFGLFLVLWTVLFLINRPAVSADGADLDTSPLAGSSNEWISGQVHAGDGISAASGGGDAGDD